LELYTRTIGALPLSIGTSMALESIFLRPAPSYDPLRKVPNTVKISNYTEIWINIQTLIRNIAQSVDRIRYMECNSLHVLEILNTEIDIITSLFQNEGSGVCLPIFYYCTYHTLKARHKNRVKFRESTTVIQRSYDLKEEQVLTRLNKSTDSIRVLDSELKPHHRSSALIMTHIPYDLTSYDQFRQLDLLESHTGVLKTRTTWNTKYAAFGQDSLSHLPFLEELLLIFGDKNHLEPQHRKTRQMVYDISLKAKWTPFFRADRVHESYRTFITHPADIQFLMEFSR